MTIGESSTKHRGVRGWLLLFCAVNAILWPPLALGILAVHALQLPPAAVWGVIYKRSVLSADALGVVLAAIGFYAGLQLWRIRPGAVRLAKSYLVLVGLTEIGAMAIPYVFGLPADVTDRVLWRNAIGAAGTVLVVGVWLLYFRYSKRVAATYASGASRV
jgi:hypothetical protein